MKSNLSKFNWKQLVEVLLAVAVVGLLVFIVVFVL